MSLPKINTPEYKLNIPSTDEEINYRPFLVKEEKLLLIAQETGDERAQYRAIQNLIKSCVKEDLAVDKLPMFDLEYIFLNIRAKSVGEIAKLNLTCPDDEKTKVDYELDLTKVNVQMDEKHSPRIQLTDKIGVLMSYPTMDLIEQYAVTGTENAANQLFKMVSNCIYQIWEGEEVHEVQDYGEKEIMEFLDSLNHEQFEKLNSFFETMPTLKHDITITNPNTNVTSTITLKGIQNFFE